ncbi:MAG TPA: hypothetical protein VMG31_07480 [Verrucomicrobiae bacterium]|nr:hypothetical protein [Verrucomicrobiae bacterium]
MSITFRIISWALIVTLPSTLMGQTSSAILHTQGGVWVNGYEARDSTAVFPGDVLETKPGFSGNLTLDGSTVLLQPESVGKLQADVLILDHGSVSVTTSKSFRVKVNCLTVVPVSNDWTQYDVTDVNGTVQVAARKLDVNVEHEATGHRASPENAAQEKASVHEGEEHSYDESGMCGAPPQVRAPSSLPNPKWIAAGAAGATGLVLCLILCRGSGSSQPLSASQP